jgi:histidine kinase
MKSYFEPTGRLIMSIGKDLIKDLPAAIVELVKNSYDADASYVKITYLKNENELKIVVEDDGHGMSQDIVLNAWMVPSTDYKLKKKNSPKGRVYQGRKGIGRYAVSLLGNKLELITIKDGFKTIACFDWDEFNSDKKLSEIPIIITTSETTDNMGTKLVITNEYGNVLADEISEIDAQKVEKELSKLLSNVNDFKIIVSYENFYSDDKRNICKEIAQLEFDDAWHYRLTGKINADFSYELTYYNFYTKEKKSFNSSFADDKILMKNSASCGGVYIDYRVYDKDPHGIEVIMNFINGNQNTKLSKTDVRNMLIDQSGISIFRSDFRIRPYGDKGFDWLNLDSKRVQNPSMSIGSEQINGRISIESEEKSGLKEKSARDGLYENTNYYVLQRVVNLSLNILQRERFNYRQKTAKKKPEAIDKLFDFSHTNEKMEKAVEKAYKNLKKYPDKTDEHISILNQEISKEIQALEREKEVEFLEVKETIAIYQKQTTLGNVISVVLHEGRKPLAWYTNKLPQMNRKLKKLEDKKEISVIGYEDLSSDINKLDYEARQMSGFFDRLDPLASNKRKKKRKVNVDEKIKAVIGIFESKIEEENITIEYDLDKNIVLDIIEEDLYMALTNIIDNAVFWVQYTKCNNKVIKIRLYGSPDDVTIEISDNGPGVPTEDITDNLLFLPGYSRKNTVLEENGTGLGLSIAGEAIQRNGGILEAVDSPNGALFRISFRNEIGNTDE